MGIVRDIRLAFAKNARKNDVQSKRAKDLKYLKKWELFRDRRDVAVGEYLIAKQR